jgi:two-component system phosphate regulon sensor histidine kinase PhoR
VLANLLHNAVKFTPPGGSVTLSAKVSAGASGGADTPSTPAAELLVTVTDTGVGILPDDLDRIFERFFKADRSRSQGGTGLGLAIAKHLIQAHGGQIWAESNGSRGTTVRFSLPTAEAPASPGSRFRASHLQPAPDRQP